MDMIVVVTTVTVVDRVYDDTPFRGGVGRFVRS
eukprot:gene27250-biopygen17777